MGYNDITKDNVGLIIADTIYAINLIWGIGGDPNFSESFYTEGHIGIVGAGPGFEDFRVQFG